MPDGDCPAIAQFTAVDDQFGTHTLTYTDEHPPQRDNPVAPATRSAHAGSKAARHTDTDHNQLYSFRGLLDHLATLTRNTITLADRTFDKIAFPTPTQHRAFQLLNTPIPLTIT